MQKKKQIIVGLVALLSAAVAAGLWQVKHFADTPLTLTEPQIYRLSVGTSRGQLEQQLIEQKLLPASPWFSWLLKVEPKLANFKAGTYRIQPGSNVRQLLQLFASGREAQFPLRLVEGQRLQDWLKTLRNAPYLDHQLTEDSPAAVAAALGVSPAQLEGYFYPDTYLYTAGRTDISVLKMAHQRMVKLLEQVWQQRETNLPYRDSMQLLTMASIIEKETALNDERKQVAAVFVNRLRKGMRLQTDPTVIYGMGLRYQGNLSRKDLESPSDYNTYTIPGLPPGPIAVPSKASLEAAAHPAASDYLYFVANGKGGHTFSLTLGSHNQAVAQWRKHQAALKETHEK